MEIAEESKQPAARGAFAWLPTLTQLGGWFDTVKQAGITLLVSDEHMTDIKTLVDYLKKDAGVPVWLVGTSRGTVSATAAAVKFGNTDLAGIVLTSSVVNYKKIGAVPSQDIASIKIPVLVLHHEQDACVHCRPYEVPAIVKGLKNAPIKKLMMVNGGSNPTGDPCEGQHYHGFIGMEKDAVAIVTDWIKKPSN